MSGATQSRGTPWLAIAWFGGVSFAGAWFIGIAVMSLAAFACPSGGPDCGPQHAFFVLFAWAIGLTVAFTVVVVAVAQLARRWAAMHYVMAALGVALLTIPALLLGRALMAGDAWLVFVAATIWFAVPGLSLLSAARGPS